MASNKNINIVESLDEHIRLYAPIMLQLLEEFPEVVHAYNLIGRDNPTALPVDLKDREYSLDGFEERATELMKPLAETTLEVQKRCKATKNIREPVTVYVRKLNDKLFNIKAQASNRIGSLHVDRNVFFSPSRKDCIITKPAILRITTLAVDHEIDQLKNACEIGLAKVVSTIKNTESINKDIFWMDDKQFDMWLADFPVDESCKPSTGMFCGTLVIDVISSHRPTVIFTSDEHFERIKENFGEECVEEMESILTSEPGNKP